MGLSANDDAAGLVQTAFGLDIVNEMQVVTSGGQAEFGRVPRWLRQLRLKKRRQQTPWRMSMAIFATSTSTRKTHSHRRSCRTHQVQSGASLGGPILKDRHLLFHNFEQRQLNQTGIITITAANAAAINTVLKAVNYPGQLLNISTTTPTTIYPTRFAPADFFAKVDPSRQRS